MGFRGLMPVFLLVSCRKCSKDLGSDHAFVAVVQMDKLVCGKLLS
jgi:hypothetical protein